MLSAKKLFTVPAKLEKLALLPVAIVLLVLTTVLPAPKEPLAGTWQDYRSDSTLPHRISVEFAANGTETQRLQTAQGLLIVKGKYTLDKADLMHIFLSASLNGKPAALPVPASSAVYRCKVAGDGLELDSHALAATVPGENFLPLAGKQLLLLRVENGK